MKRREFIGCWFGFFSFAGLPKAFASEQIKIVDSEYTATFSALIDVLLPGDETPSGSDLGVDRKVLEYGRTVSNYSKLIQLGCYWLNLKSKALYKAKFIQLSDAQQIKVVTLLESSPQGNIEQQFFERVLSDAFRFYYSEPASWSLFALNGSPQPMGYPDYSQKETG